MTAPLDTLTLAQLFIRQAQLNADHERLLTARNNCAAGSFDWDLHNAALTGSMQDIADLAREITRRITAQLSADPDTDDGRLTDVPMVCTRCRKPVEPVPGRRTTWTHKTVDFTRPGCVPAGGIKAMVAAGNENVARDA
jgi:hypothetical protein